MVVTYHASGQSAWPSYPNNKAISISSQGNVGIGTYPSRTLHINASNAAVAIQDSNVGGHQYVFTNVGPGDGTMGLYDATLSAFRWSVTPTGNFGIGTSNPTQRQLVINNSGPDILGIKLTTNNYNWFVDNRGSRSTPPNSFAIGNDAAVLLTITPSGNVGIGTTNPQSTLAVNGTITTKEVVVTNTGWSDYVFRPGYRLAPLSEIKAYVETYQHLPGIPSETEVKANGVNMGDMQAKLLAKIEELTLHMINAEERNRRLETCNEELLERVRRLEAQQK